MNEQAIEQAFTEATLAATEILKFAVEFPPDLVEVDGKLVKTADPAVQAQGVAYLAKALARRVAQLSVPGYVEHMAVQTQIRKQRIARREAIASAAALHKSQCDGSCVECEIERFDAALDAGIIDKAAAKVDDTRPPEWERAQRDGTVQSVPWRADEDEAKPRTVAPGVSKRILAEAGFDDQGDNEYVHPRDGHVLKMAADGFIIVSGWDGQTAFKGETIADFREALAVLDE